MLLQDNFRVVGTDEEEFVAENARMESVTKELLISGMNITFLSLCLIPRLQKAGCVAFYYLSVASLDAFLNGEALPVRYIPAEKFGSQEVIDEMKKTTNLALAIDNKLYVVSDIAIRTFTLRAEVKGDVTMARQNLIRNMHLADAILNKKMNEKIHLVYRTEVINGVLVRKVFAGLGNQYKLIPQTIITKSIEKLSSDGTLGEVVMDSFEIDHEFTTAVVSLPGIADAIAEEKKLSEKFIPGLYLSTSDTGSSSVIIRGTYRTGARSYVITDEVTLKHAGNITPERILSDADERIFTNIRKLPETLCDLMGRELAPYASLDLTSPKGSEKNFKAVKKVYEEMISYICKEANISGKKREALTEGMIAEINPEIAYTLYDVAVTFMGVADRIEGLDRDTVTRLRKACGQVPYRLQKKTNNKADDEKIVVMPA